jgi:hypothetical protein
MGGGVLFVLHRQNAAALAAAASKEAAAARAAAGARHNDFDLGRALTELGGLVIDKGIAYLAGGPAGVAASEARGSALLV